MYRGKEVFSPLFSSSGKQRNTEPALKEHIPVFYEEVKHIPIIAIEIPGSFQIFYIKKNLFYRRMSIENG
jgi:hypothetical protein